MELLRVKECVVFTAHITHFSLCTNKKKTSKILRLRGRCRWLRLKWLHSKTRAIFCIQHDTCKYNIRSCSEIHWVCHIHNTFKLHCPCVVTMNRRCEKKREKTKKYYRERNREWRWKMKNRVWKMQAGKQASKRAVYNLLRLKERDQIQQKIHIFNGRATVYANNM